MEQREFRMPATGEGWRHYKGGLYTIIGMAQDAEGRAMVVYTEYRWSLIQLPPIYVRELGEFVSQVEIDKGSSCTKSTMRPRFQFERAREEDEICPFIHPVNGSGFRKIDDVHHLD